MYSVRSLDRRLIFRVPLVIRLITSRDLFKRLRVAMAMTMRRMARSRLVIIKRSVKIRSYNKNICSPNQAKMNERSPYSIKNL